MEQIKIHVDKLKGEKDTAGRVSFYIQLGILKGFRGWCIQKGYVDPNNPNFEFKTNCSDYLSAVAIKRAYELEVKERLTDIDNNLKSLFSKM